MRSFVVEFGNTEQSMEAVLAGSGNVLTADFESALKIVVSDAHEHYAGDYTVIPQTEAQVLPTKDRIMVDNVTVKAIPYYETDNTQGGSTVYIGSEI